MSRSVTTGVTDTAQAGITPLTFAMSPVNFSTDYKPVGDGSDGSIVYTNVTTPADQLETIRIAQRARANVYSGTSIDPSVYVANKAGIDTVVGIRAILRETDSVDVAYQRDLPLAASLTLQLPVAAQVTSTVVENLVKRLVAAALYAQGVQTPTTGIVALQHGIVKK